MTGTLRVRPRLHGFRLAQLVLLGLVVLVAGCRRYESNSAILWSAHRQPDPAAEYDGASMLWDGRQTWVASVDSPSAAVPRISLRRVEWQAGDLQSQPLQGEIVGTNPSLVQLNSSTLGLLYRTVDEEAQSQLVFRRFFTKRRKWGKPRRITQTTGIHLLASDQLVKTSDGTLIFPALHLSVPDSLQTARVDCYRSTNNGKDWELLPTPLGSEVRMPAIAEAADGRLVMIMNIYGELHRARSSSGGRFWSSPERLGLLAKQTPHVLHRIRDGSELLLVWTDQRINPREALPTIRPLRGALSRDDGETWQGITDIVIRPGCGPQAPAVAVTASELQIAYELTRSDERLPKQTMLPLSKLRNPLENMRDPTPYVPDAHDLREALRVLVSHTLQRPKRARYLFVESYFMRGLLKAHEALQDYREEHADWLDTALGIQQAIDYADSLVASQDSEGYWHLGYGDRWLADMAVAVGVFKSLEAHVDDERMERYQTSVERFLAAVEGDGMFLSSGAVGVGKPRGRDAPLNRTPYIVSTALVGVETRAWLHTRTGRQNDRDAALRSLDYLLASIRPDGSVPPFPRETPLQEAVYLQEGLMAADMLLGGEEILERIKPHLPRHIDWILRQQNELGTWGVPEDGSLQRSTMLINFLIWYDQRCEAREDVRMALRRASRALNLDVWRQHGLLDDNIGGEVFRGLAGRPLAALVRGAYVF